MRWNKNYERKYWSYKKYWLNLKKLNLIKKVHIDFNYEIFIFKARIFEIKFNIIWWQK